MNWDWEKLQQRQQERNRGSGENGGGAPPQFDDVLNKLKDFRFKSGWILLIVLAVVILLGSSMVYTVESNEVGVVQRFGKYIRTTQSGLHFKLPIGIEEVTKVKTKRVYTEEFGLKTGGESIRFADQQGMDVALMLTGDLNVAIVPWIVQYRVKDPYNYLFKVEDVNRLIRDMAEASMRLVVGDRSINEIISKRHEIAAEAQVGLQKDLDEAETGIEIATVELGNTNVPQPVQDSFNEVNRAVQQKEETIYKARQDYNRVIPKASGEAQKTVESAKGYAAERINRAKGDSDRFASMFQAYNEAKDVTRRRLFLEMLEDVLPEIGDKYIIDSQQDSLLPLLNMGKDKGKQNAVQ